jgi:hypothetical protein
MKTILPYIILIIGIFVLGSLLFANWIGMEFSHLIFAVGLTILLVAGVFAKFINN